MNILSAATEFNLDAIGQVIQPTHTFFVLCEIRSFRYVQHVVG